MRVAFGAMAMTCRRVQPWLCVFGLLLSATVLAEVKVEVLDSGSQIYSNVTVTSRTSTHVFIQHTRGFASLKLTDLPDEALVQLGYRVTEKVPPPSAIRAALKVPEALKPDLEELGIDPKIKQTDEGVSMEVNHQSLVFEKHVLKAAAACLGIIYVIFCYAATLICRKCAVKPGIWCWIPIVQWAFLLRAARLPAWWIILWILPVSTLPLWIVWCVKICKARGKGFFAIFFLLFPPTTPLAFLYLALAGEPKPKSSVSNKVRLSYAQAA